MLMLFPWPDNLRINVSDGQLGVVKGMTWRQYLALVGEFWEKTYRYPRHHITIDNSQITRVEQTYNGQLFGLAVRAMLERGYLDMQGNIHPPVPFAPPPDEYRSKPS